jgi:hypothetical protein
VARDDGPRASRWLWCAALTQLPGCLHHGRGSRAVLRRPRRHAAQHRRVGARGASRRGPDRAGDERVGRGHVPARRVSQSGLRTGPRALRSPHGARGKDRRRRPPAPAARPLLVERTQLFSWNAPNREALARRDLGFRCVVRPGGGSPQQVAEGLAQ